MGIRNPFQATSDQKEVIETTIVDDSVPDPVIVNNGTIRDQQDMTRLGKQQELKRNFRFISILGFTVTLMSTWESMLVASTFGLIDGGFAGLIWVYLGTFCGFFAVVCSMAEMASIAPTSGGQYHWVSEFAPRSMQRFLSYMVGWVSMLGWQTGTASAAFLAGTIIQGLLALNKDTYVPERWHGTLFVIALSGFAIFFNTYGASRLPTLEGLVLILHIFGFVAILVPLWVLATPNTPTQVFTEFVNGGGWSSVGAACVVGQISPVYAFVGPDSAAHMAEEVKDASKIIPRCMVWTAIINGIMGFVMLVTFCFCMTDVEAALGTATGYPFLEVFYQVTGSKGGATAMACIIVVLIVCASISILATASRQTFAFARDEGLPYSKFFAHVNPRWQLPLNSIMVSFVVTVLLSLINIGSTAAFNAIASLSVVSLFTGYIMSIGCYTWKKLTHQPLPPSRWSMGRIGPAVNIFALLWLAFAIIMAFFPIATPVTPETMNWAILVYGAVVIFAVGAFFVRGRKAYSGPVVLIKQN
ncbi:MAG: hypothetical protein M1833_000241 [Piccolia ochrophora]|nr:MAG: hypothetical protein M1833_000241 [Piccolia ochrophora]